MIFVDELIPLLPERLRAIEPVTTFAGRTLSRQMLLDNDAHALFVRTTTQVNADLLRGTNVRFVGTASVGTDHVDIPWLAYQDIEFASAPGSNAWAVVEYVYAWIRAMGKQPGCNVGIIGHGNIGSRLDVVLKRLGYSTAIYDPLKFGHTTEVLQNLLGQSDVVSIHVPLTQTGNHATVGMIGPEQVQLLKQGALFIQTSRGGVVSDESLAVRTQQGTLACVLDVFASEPDVPLDLVRTVTHCTPHIAGHSIDGKLRGASMIADVYLEFLNGNRVTGLASTASSIQSVVPPAKTTIEGMLLRDVVAEARWFVAAYSESAGRDRFDFLRKTYEPKSEVLRQMLGIDD